MDRLLITMVVFLMLGGALIECSDGSKKAKGVHGRMVGGTKAKRRHWRFIAYLHFTQPKPLWKTCGAALIAKNFILTAAHCIEDIVTTPQYVTVGVHVMKRRHKFKVGKNVTVAKIIPHPDFKLPAQRADANDWSFDADIAILKLSKEVTGRRIPVDLPLATEDISSQTNPNCRVAGWGKATPFKTEEEQASNIYEVAKRLSEIKIPLQSKQTCLNSLDEQMKPFYGPNLRHLICGGTLGSKEKGTTCSGDSGSPLVCKTSQGVDVLQGIVLSGGYLCKPGDEYMFFGEVAKFRSWIDRAMRDNA